MITQRDIVSGECVAARRIVVFEGCAGKVGCIEGIDASDHLVQDRAKRKDIGALVGFVGVSEKFGCEVTKGSKGCAVKRASTVDLCEFALLRDVGGKAFCDAKVGDLGQQALFCFGEQDIGGFEIAMDDALLVEGFDAAHDQRKELSDHAEA